MADRKYLLINKERQKEAKEYLSSFDLSSVDLRVLIAGNWFASISKGERASVLKEFGVRRRLTKPILLLAFRNKLARDFSTSKGWNKIFY
ncbi:MAG: hypothetical protein CV045_14285 [Cyanobacteria bacterium M5B4]|nr:MAG: hypothetical protein CV045_14285 [Cyanobacteria bacterium M5B4]